MFKKIKSLIILPVIALSVGLAAMPVVVYAQDPKTAACEGLALTGGQCDSPTNPNGSSGQLNRVIGTVINIFSLIVGVTAVIMIIIAGLKYITSMGDSASTASAKNTILYAVIGLVIVALAQTIVRFVLSRI